MASGSAGNFQSIPVLRPEQVPIPTTAGSVNIYMNVDDNLNVWTVDHFKVHRPITSSAMEQIQTIKSGLHINRLYNDPNGPSPCAQIFNMFKFTGKVKVFSVVLFNKTVAQYPGDGFTNQQGSVQMGTCVYDGTQSGQNDGTSPAGNIPNGNIKLLAVGSVLYRQGSVNPAGVGHILNSNQLGGAFQLQSSGYLPGAFAASDVAPPAIPVNNAVTLSANTNDEGFEVFLRPTPNKDNFISIIFPADQSFTTSYPQLDAVYDAYIYWSPVDTGAKVEAAANNY